MISRRKLLCVLGSTPNIPMEPVQPVYKSASPAITFSVVDSAEITYKHPVGISEGDLLVTVGISVKLPGSTMPVVPPVGYKELSYRTADNLTHYLSYKIADGTEVGGTLVAHTWNEVPTGARIYGVMYVFSNPYKRNSVTNIDLNPVLLDTGQDFSNSNNSTEDKMLAVSIYIQEDNIAVTDTSSGYTTNSLLTTLEFSDLTMAVGTQVLALSGDADGTQKFTAGVADNNTNIGFMIKPKLIPIV